MKCLEREELFGYAERLLEPRRDQAVREHLGGCARCRAAVEEYGALDRALDEWTIAAPRPDAVGRVRAALAERKSEAAGRRETWIGWDWRLAASLAVVALVVALVVFRARPPEPVPPAPVREPSSAQVEPPAPEAPPAVAPRPERPTSPAPEATNGEEELTSEESLPGIEDYDMLANFDLISELSRGRKEVEN